MGGKLFELWFIACGRSSLFHQCHKDIVNTGKISPSTALKVIQSQKTPFYMFCMKSMKDMSNKNTSQLFWLSFIGEWKGIYLIQLMLTTGLSGLGLTTFSHFNTNLSRSTYQRLKGKLIDYVQVENALRLRLFRKPGIIWIDNYAKYFARGIPDLLNDSVNEVKLTGM